MLNRESIRKKAFSSRQPVENVADQGTIIKKLIQSSRQSGRCNLSSQALSELPNLLFEDEATTKDVSFDTPSNWWENVELVRLLAADNKLTKIDERVGLLGALVVLDLHGNQISEIPAALGRLENLQILNLSYNAIVEFPSELCDLNLLELHLQNNELSNLPSNFGYLVNLKKLDLSNNKLQALPETMASLTKLLELDLSSNLLKSLDPLDLNRLAMLSTLIVSRNELTKFTYRNQVTLSRLQVLDVKYNQLKSWTTVLNCPLLKDFCVAFNKISTVSQGTFSKCPEIEVFDIRDNNIGSIPADVLSLFNLKRLDITNNSVNILPPELSLIKTLVAIHFTGNHALRGLPTTGGTVKLLEYLANKIVFTDNTRNTQDSRQATGKNMKLSGLNLMNLDISEVKETSETLPTILNLSQNHLEKLPNHFDELTENLTSLALNKNRLVEFPTLANCSNLVVLDLSGNLISICQRLAPLPNLSSLNLNNNQLTVFPPLPYTNLSVLLISSNKLRNVDMDVLNQMKSLNTLDLSNNDIDRVPPELGKITTLNNLQLMGNSFKIPRVQILQKGTGAILEYLRSRISE